MTYDVDKTDLDLVLVDSTDAIPAIDCAINIYANASGDSLCSLDKSLLNRNDRLHHLLEERLRSLIQNDGSGMDTFLGEAWPGYIPSVQGWTAHESDNERWISTLSGVGKDKRHVHYNLLSGQLMINGSLLKRLPDNLFQRPLYKQIFGTVSFNYYDYLSIPGSGRANFRLDNAGCCARKRGYAI